jgi:enoyl-CoA hydratase/carnithine racemase
MLETLDHDDGAIRELRLDRPPVNALTPELLAALRDALEAAPAAGARALVVSGRPGMFSAGLDVPCLLGLDRAGIEGLMANLFAALRALAFSPVPSVAAVTGHSPAGGAVLALMCDRRVMAAGDAESRFRIGLNEIEVGLPVPPAIFAAIARRTGRREAERLCLEGLLVDSEEALALGLVDELAPAGEVVGRALVWCRSLLARPPAALAATRAVARADLHAAFAGFEDQLGGFADAWFAGETQAAMRALVAKLAARSR